MERLGFGGARGRCTIVTWRQCNGLASSLLNLTMPHTALSITLRIIPSIPRSLLLEKASFSIVREFRNDPESFSEQKYIRISVTGSASAFSPVRTQASRCEMPDVRWRALLRSGGRCTILTSIHLYDNIHYPNPGNDRQKCIIAPRLQVQIKKNKGLIYMRAWLKPWNDYLEPYRRGVC